MTVGGIVAGSRGIRLTGVPCGLRGSLSSRRPGEAPRRWFASCCLGGVGDLKPWARRHWPQLFTGTLIEHRVDATLQFACGGFEVEVSVGSRVAGWDRRYADASVPAEEQLRPLPRARWLFKMATGSSGARRIGPPAEPRLAWGVDAAIGLACAVKKHADGPAFLQFGGCGANRLPIACTSVDGVGTTGRINRPSKRDPE